MFAYPATNVVLRGCVGDDDTPPEQSLQFASKCNEPNCNSKPIKPEFCHSYTYSKQDLIDGVNIGDVIKCGVTIEPSGCYYQGDGERETIQTGCVSELANEHPRDNMRICKDYECNQEFSFMTCLEHEQKYGPHLHYDDVKIKLCNGVDSCFTYIHNLTYYERGCQSDMLSMNSERCESSEDMCVACNENLGCNRMGLVFMPEQSDNDDGDEDEDEFKSAETNGSAETNSGDKKSEEDSDNKSVEDEKPTDIVVEDGSKNDSIKSDNDQNSTEEPQETETPSETDEQEKPEIVIDPVIDDEPNAPDAAASPGDPNEQNDASGTGLSQGSIIAIVLAVIIILVIASVFIYRYKSIGGLGKVSLCSKNRIENAESSV